MGVSSRSGVPPRSTATPAILNQPRCNCVEGAIVCAIESTSAVSAVRTLLTGTPSHKPTACSLFNRSRVWLITGRRGARSSSQGFFHSFAPAGGKSPSSLVRFVGVSVVDNACLIFYSRASFGNKSCWIAESSFASVVSQSLAPSKSSTPLPVKQEDRASRHARDGDDAALHSQIHGPIHNQSRTQSHSSRYAGTGGSGRGARIASYHLTTATSASTSAATSASPRATSPFAGAPTPIEAFLQQCQDHSSPSPEKSLDHWGWEAQDSLSDDALADRSLRSSWASGEPAADGEEGDNTVAPPPPPPAPPAPPPPSRGYDKP